MIIVTKEKKYKIQVQWKGNKRWLDAGKNLYPKRGMSKIVALRELNKRKSPSQYRQRLKLVR